MTTPTTAVPESPALVLLVRCTASGLREWAAWGGQILAAGVWRFVVADEPALLDLLERLNASLPHGAQADTLATVGPVEESATTLPLDRLAELHSLPVLLARRRYPWLISDLNSRIRSDLQPIVDLTHGGQRFAYEALGRGITPEGVLLEGQQLFALAAQADRLEALDAACQRAALRAKALLPAGMPLFINILPYSLMNLDLRREPWTQLAIWGIRPEEIVLEIVESERFDDLQALVDATDRLRHLGFRIALDDVGSGYNSLTVLATLRPDYLKLDQGLVQGVQGSQVRLALLQALISMAQRLGCALVAEGLERIEDILLCRDLGVHFGQGYYFAPPTPEALLPKPLPPQPAVSRPYRTNMVRLRDVTEPVATLPLEANSEHAHEYFRQHPDRPTVIVLDDRKPVGYLTRRGARLQQQRQIGLGRHCKPLNKLLPEQMSARALIFRLYHDPDPAQPWVVVDSGGDYLGTLEPWTILTQLFAGPAREGVHPLSHLPTGPVLRDTIDLRLRTQKAQTLVYIDLDHFKAFNDRYGFVRGDAMIMLLAEVLRQTFRTLPDTYLGHIGGDDFIAVAPYDSEQFLLVLEHLLVSFRDLAAYLYDSDDLQRGYFTTEDGSPHPTAAISVVIIHGQRGQIANSLVASERVAQLKTLAKAQLGSVIAIDDTPPRFITVSARQAQAHRWEEFAIQALLDIAAQPRSGQRHDLDPVFKRYPFFELIYELDAAGVQRHPNWVHPEMWGRLKGGGGGVERSAQPYFQLVAHRRVPYVSNLYLSSASGEFCATVAVPLQDAAGGFDGALVGDMNLAGLVALNRTLQQEPT